MNKQIQQLTKSFANVDLDQIAQSSIFDFTDDRYFFRDSLGGQTHHQLRL